jgi:uncharacterized Zn-finger protein
MLLFFFIRVVRAVRGQVIGKSGAFTLNCKRAHIENSHPRVYHQQVA